MRLRLAAAVVFALTASLTVVGGGARAASCAPAGAGGEWPSYGRDLSNSRNQSLETQIGAESIGTVQPAWSFSAAPLEGSFQTTPVIADGCVFMTSSLGFVYALNADTGELVWRNFLPSLQGFFAPSLVNGRVHLLAGNPFLPYSAALDQATGELLWITPLVDHSTGFVNASAFVSNGLVFAALAGRDVLDPFSRPAFFILDEATGEIVKQTRVIPDEEAFEGTSPVGGGGIWTTAVLDPGTMYLYAGTANPYSKKIEHERTNAILKIDFDRSRATFGEIVGSYKGDYDYIPDRYNSVECQTLGDAQPVFYSVACGQQDVDFGASPNLFRTSDGRLLVGDFQKSGTYHAVDAATMELVWKTQVAPPSLSGNASSSAFDADSVFVHSNGDKLSALDKDTGAVTWTATYDTGGTHYQPVSVANGVVYTISNLGQLRAFDAGTGAVLRASTIAGTGLISCAGASGAGVAVARNTVYAACDSGTDRGGLLVAYR